MRQDRNLLNGASAWPCASFPMRIVKVLDWDAPFFVVRKALDTQLGAIRR